MARMTMKTALDNLTYNYGKYGSRKQFYNMIKSGVEKYGFSVHAAYVGVKLVIAEQTGEQEFFSSADIAEITGETIEEVNKRIEEMQADMISNGINPDAYMKKRVSNTYTIRL